MSNSETVRSLEPPVRMREEEEEEEEELFPTETEIMANIGPSCAPSIASFTLLSSKLHAKMFPLESPVST